MKNFTATMAGLILVLVQAIAFAELVSSEPSIRGETDDISFSNFVQHTDHKLDGKPFKKTLASVFDCLIECNVEGRCLSININTTSDDQGLSECVLLNSEKHEYLEKFTPAKGIDHYSMPFDSSLLESCAAIKKANNNAPSGLYRIRTSPTRSPQVYCDMVTNGGGWTVFQRRLDGSVDFYRGWSNYTVGFGNKSGEYWLGLDRIYEMTSRRKNRLRVDLEDFEGNTRYAEYGIFSVDGAAQKYRLTIGDYSGTAEDSLNLHNNMLFTTKDQDNDASPSNCAQDFTGAWWYNSCHYSNLNGLYLEGSTSLFAKGVVWRDWKGHLYSLKRAEMKIRPLDF